MTQETVATALTHFSYTAADAQGTIHRGLLAAANTHDLAAKLQENKFFLISAEVLEVIDESSNTVTPATDLQTVTKEKGRHHVLLGILAAGVLVLALQTHHRHAIRHGDTSILNQKMASLKRGMSQSDIEQLLGKVYPGNSDPNKVWYGVPPQFIIEITYGKKATDSKQNQSICTAINILKAPKPF